MPAGGSYTVTPSLSGQSFTPGFYEFDDPNANQTANFAESTSPGSDDWNGFWGIPINSSATPSGTSCDDISGSWTETDQYGSSTWNLTEDNSGNVSGTVDFTNGGSCGTITYQTVTGSESNGVFTLTASNPTALQDACGYPITPTEQQSVTLSTSGSCSTGSANWTSEFGSGPSTWDGQVPTSLSVQNVHVYSYEEEVQAGYPPACYGIVIGITYQLMDQKNPPQPIRVAGLVPQEMMSNPKANGVPLPIDPDPKKDIVFKQFVDIYPATR